MELSAQDARTIAENRLKAKARVQERERHLVAASSSILNANAKRPLQVVPASSTSPTAPNTRRTHATNPTWGTTTSSNALQQALASGSGQQVGVTHFQGADKNAPLKNMIGNYIEYDLATVKNSKGGFLLDNEEDDPRKIRARQMEEALRQKRIENAQKQGQLREPKMALDQQHNPKCRHCGSMDLDTQLRTIFGVFVCAKHKAELPDLYSLLTKTECKEDYLLTDSELRDEELLPHLLRPNPHRPTYSNMMLFLRVQVEEFAFSDKKWGSPEALDAEFEKREAEKIDKKSKKFAQKLQELRKKTKTNVWHKRVEGEHEHHFEEGEGEGVQVCSECGFKVEVETF
ncbi:BZ3500_MvSof-1268-A1-R1_Chr5-3g08226 [Microbotryum saponariae]|uniref:DNA repair protein RAD14 n=1 Tax=Microbotryum saponariae TaxID=289078 RepID=A0A2X0KFL9_9BASI|nr:BZ3500_MvSof-1268-A1-R1_Chr5-3g08226 [Microbotryum saponariae]SDA07985.1 BZ3501_MvSof-1269-A2-R1_Chr5-1g07370 [Microbotryum saponariae]